MLLRSVRVENYRAVKSAKICFDPTTILIGENDCGRSSLMEAIALALGWNARAEEFRFEPFHLYRAEVTEQSAKPSITIELEFCESNDEEWNGSDYDALRSSLPDIATGERRFRLEVIHPAEGSTSWTFRAGGGQPAINDRPLLAWLRRAMPVFRLTEGMAGRIETVPETQTDEPTRLLAEEVTKRCRELMQGTTLDLHGSLNSGASAAAELMRIRACLMTDPATAGAALQEITGKRKFRKNEDIPEGVRELGTAAQKLGMLYLVGAFLRSGGARVEQGMTPLILVENPEAHLHPMTLASIWGVIERVEGQKIIGTHSGTLLSSARLSSLRRLTRREGVVHEWRVPEGSLKPDELRRYTYHLRSRRSAASFARCWLLVEGETEFWLMGELARVCGYDFASEGIACVEFAQCGLDAPIKVARHLGIDWHLLADGDAAGQIYVRTALQYASGNPKQRITLLQEPDVEHCFWWHGYANIFRKAAYPALPPHEMREIKVRAKAVIHRAIERQSKPAMAIRLLDAVSDPGSSGVPAPLRSAIETCVRLARGA